MSSLVCKCNNVTAQDVEVFYKHYPEMQQEQMKRALNIGLNCGCCNYKDCTIIDKNFNDIYVHLNRYNI